MAQSIDSIPSDFKLFLDDRLASGRYGSAEDVFRAAKEALMREEADDDLDVEYVRHAIAEADASGIYEGDIFAELRARYNLAPRA